ncbi:M56 family metallopeptidase [Gorillibacterium massiliense]|uniref:M56 family metallopeptidase n=1 Tax=Gorillibacterium massiliense TaxID=1280390 RepID=UPI000694C3B0|nr:M56 family metallopeptidase [Gorillibacterium massiliense]
MWEKRSNWMLIFVMLTAGMVFVQFAMFLGQFLFHIRMPMNLFNLCIEYLRFIGMPVRMNLMIFLVGSTLMISLGAVIREIAASLRWRKLELRLGDEERKRLLCTEHGLSPMDLTVIDHNEPVAMTIGVLRPRIVLSTGLISTLSSVELRAVIAHEKFHLMKKHPLAMLLLSLLALTFWYIPIYKWVMDKYKVLIELMADRHAVQTTGSAAGLGGALLVLIKRGQGTPSALGNVSFAGTALNLRLKQLMDPQFKPAFRPPVVASCISVVIFTFVVFGLF